MRLTDAKIELSQKIADALNESKLNPTQKIMILMEISRTLAQLEEQQFQQALESEKGE